jgi:exodeoxyribonuclease VII large subunit
MPSFASQTILTVTQLTRSIKTILENEYRFIRISGEISNLKTPYSGHSYFTLKDGNSQIRGVLFKQQKRYLNLSLKDGQQVICFGRITVYEPRGDYQIIVDTVELFGTGKLQIQYEKLKQKLLDKGYFDESQKKDIPLFPEKIIIISSATGAAIHDFLKIAKNRNSHMHLQIIPVRVQGKTAAAEIAQAIAKAQTINGVEIIVLCRGGGSLEDLWAFNEEEVAQAIFMSEIPIVTGIGHEIDFSIADFCADFRCPTPTGVAEKVIPDNGQLKKRVSALRANLVNRIRQKLIISEQELNHSIKMLGSLKTILNSSYFRLSMSESLLCRVMEKQLEDKSRIVFELRQNLEAKAPLSRINLQENRLQFLTRLLKQSIENIIVSRQAELAGHANLLNGVSPLATLARGYSIVRKVVQSGENYCVISKTTDTCIGDRINILLHEGQIDCTVNTLRED